MRLREELGQTLLRIRETTTADGHDSATIVHATESHILTVNTKTKLVISVSHIKRNPETQKPVARDVTREGGWQLLPTSGREGAGGNPQKHDHQV